MQPWFKQNNAQILLELAIHQPRLSRTLPRRTIAGSLIQHGHPMPYNNIEGVAAREGSFDPAIYETARRKRKGLSITQAVSASLLVLGRSLALLTLTGTFCFVMSWINHKVFLENKFSFVSNNAFCILQCHRP